MMTKQEFLNTIASIVRAENLRRGNILFNSVVIAQAICESGWGQSEIMMKANAVFGIKAYGWNGKVYNATTKECYDGKNYTNVEACFRAYNSLEESVKDYFDLITTSPRYRKACVAGSPLECITEIKNGGYATSPTYINTIMSIINSNNLTKYDFVSQETSKYNVGKNYTLQDNMFVRTGAGTNYSIKSVRELTQDGKKHAVSSNLNDNAVLKKGTIVTCLEVIKENNNIWLRIPSGYVAGFHNGTEFIK